MADEVVVESKADSEVQAKAEKLGWIPPARFKGDPDRFIDAEEYIERGETVLPIVREQNKRLHAELNAVKAESVKTAAALQAAQDAIADIEERHTVATQKAVEEARAKLKSQLAAASEAGDHEAIAELTGQMVELGKAEKKAETREEKRETPPAAFVPPPELQAWNAENPWFGTNKRKTALALGIAQELRESGESLTGRAFFDRVVEEVNKELGTQREEPRGDKVEGARQNGDGGSVRGKTFASLPAEAKAACDADARNFVGPTKKYKTQAEWRSRYAQLYFQE